MEKFVVIESTLNTLVPGTGQRKRVYCGLVLDAVENDVSIYRFAHTGNWRDTKEEAFKDAKKSERRKKEVAKKKGRKK